ncbi:hypothetical protein TgHK011_003128 [Trichoderma gracile]|nr:hypothetical protein TgHK011_003128 [Trichoderma gracile]
MDHGLPGIGSSETENPDRSMKSRRSVLAADLAFAPMAQSPASLNPSSFFPLFISVQPRTGVSGAVAWTDDRLIRRDGLPLNASQEPWLRCQNSKPGAE